MAWYTYQCFTELGGLWVTAAGTCWVPATSTGWPDCTANAQLLPALCAQAEMHSQPLRSTTACLQQTETRPRMGTSTSRAPTTSKTLCRHR